MNIPLSRPLIGREEEDAVLEVLRSGMLAQGPRVAALEAAFAEVCAVPHAVAVSNGTAALFLALLAHGIGPGDEVITTPFSFIATGNSVLMTGARPVFVDIEPVTFNLAVEQIEAAINERTRAIMPVHLYGHPAEMDAMLALAERHGLAVIEDAAQAVGAIYHGRPTGSFGTACFSLYATKNIMAGEGGIITTNDPAIAERLRLLRNHGSRVRYYHDLLGYNLRMTDLQAAIGLTQLAKLEDFTTRRMANAAFLNAQIKHPLLTTPTSSTAVRHVFHQYTLRISGNRDAAAHQLSDAGIGNAIFYPVLIPNQPFYRDMGYNVRLPVAEQITQEVLSLPVHPGLHEADLERIAAAVNRLELG
ncbi:DegT/DnrJ/EryC1/StrS family aminotransferase [Candidatus Viridilinea mediisalina]|uniref:Aminotransferase DegT n=1 Tax=Candidatus Viridilinea mediisalina TaxID=2024553 RepID=A0A2A6RP89_9CHLR|nr:DegT/DnrJ/EryC1/StrS family aminotransferase [Candidatus Viridilinea mediisalina]PDW04763.1 aminotransferase DegT [Candidatus Viridilinea mediisalina]